MPKAVYKLRVESQKPSGFYEKRFQEFCKLLKEQYKLATGKDDIRIQDLEIHIYEDVNKD